MKKTVQVAIDGPAGAGKSSVAKRLAKQLNYLYLDTGAMYRTITLKAIQTHLDLEPSVQLEQLVKHTSIDFGELDQEGRQLIYCDGHDVTDQIRTTDISNNVSKISAMLIVREVLVRKQQEIANNRDVVMDGRDIGTVVLPQASFKFFLTASLEARTQRRYNELVAKGVVVDFTELQQQIALRDRLDSEREASPLVAAHDAIHIDTSCMSLDDVVEKLLMIIQK